MSEKTLAEAREYVQQAIWGSGTVCMCCDQKAKVQHVKLNSGMAYALLLVVRFFNKNPTDVWLHVPNYLTSLKDKRANEGSFAKLRHWGLVEMKREQKEDKNPNNGFWRVTPKGFLFAHGEIEVPRKVNIYAAQCKGYDEKEFTDIHLALKDPFIYSELMES